MVKWVGAWVTAALLMVVVAAARGLGQQPPAAGKQREVVLLGSDELTAGIPGEGALQIAEIKQWLAEPRNHQHLQPRLPPGLAAGATQMRGLVENPLTRAKIELGRQLYFDPRLSRDHSISCASCHDPPHGFADDAQVSLGVDGQAGGRNSPVAYNRIFSNAQFWDGRAATLEVQAIGPIANPVEMSNTHDACVAHLRTIGGYRLQFAQLFADGLTIDNVAKALACFERVLVTGTAPWDHHERLASFRKIYRDDLEYLDELEEDDPELYQEYQTLLSASAANPVSKAAIRGGELFFGKANCSVCHNGVNYTDELYHNLGVGMERHDPDLGRYEVTGAAEDRGKFKTPTLRNVEQTAPYMHDGSQATLLSVVEWYDQGGHPNPWLADDVEKLNLTDDEQAALVAFMKALTGRLPRVETGRLPE